jgi:hypothetical protein
MGFGPKGRVVLRGAKRVLTLLKSPRKVNKKQKGR